MSRDMTLQVARIYFPLDWFLAVLHRHETRASPKQTLQAIDSRFLLSVEEGETLWYTGYPPLPSSQL